MKIVRPLRQAALGMLLALILTAAVLAADQPWNLYAEAMDPAVGTAQVRLQQEDGSYYLFLPSSVDLGHLTLCFEGGPAVISGPAGGITLESGAAFSLGSLFFGEQDRYPVILRRGTEELQVTVMHSEGLRSVFITSPSPDQGREYVDADKDRKVKGGGFTLLRADGTTVWSGTMKNIKSRGNSTWGYPKKPYQVKLSEKVDLLETGDAREAAATWILLANYWDGSMMHNQLTFGLAAEFGLQYTAHSQQADLYYDGEYRGTYEICEKTEIGKARVAIHDLEGDIEDANPEVEDMDALGTVEVSAGNDRLYQYVSGLSLPEDYSGGYLLEMDYVSRAREEKSWFRTGHKQYIVSKSPEYLPEEAMVYISDLYQQFEDAVYAGGVDPVTGKDYRDLVDLQSLARCFLIMELAEDNDAFSSSTFFYKPQDEEKFYAGPVWDFDTGYGSASVPEDCAVAGGSVLGSKLLKIESFREALQAAYGELEPLIRDIVLGDEDAAGEILRSIESYGRETEASRAMNAVLWKNHADITADAAIGELRDHIAHRTDWLSAQIARWVQGDIPEWSFADVSEDAWYFEAVNYAVTNGMFYGVSGILFSPETVMTRAMAVTVLHRMAGEPETMTENVFLDVPTDAWYAEGVNWAAENGIVLGVGEGRFDTDSTITREQFVTILYRYAEFAGADMTGGVDLGSFPDAETVSPWARDAMSWAIGQGIIQGSDGYIDPLNGTMRAQAAAILMRFHLSVGRASDISEGGANVLLDREPRKVSR